MNLEIDKVFLTNEFCPNGKDSNNVNTDVIVQLNTGEKYIASFFLFKKIEVIKKGNLKSGAFLNGKYYWSKNMLLIDSISIESIKLVIQHLIDEGDFNQVFAKITK